MAQLYEGMFLLDNQVVREDWRKAKSIVTETLSKHGASVRCARRWDERKLAYPIRRRRRATFCLAFYEMGSESIAALRRDLELNENVLRYLMLARAVLPEGEHDLCAAEDAADFAIPAPPPDDAPDAPVAARSRASRPDEDGESSDDPRLTRSSNEASGDDESEEPGDDASEKEE